MMKGVVVQVNKIRSSLSKGPNLRPGIENDPIKFGTRK